MTSYPTVQSGEWLTPRRLFVVLGVLAALSIIGFRAQSLIGERAQVVQQKRAQAATLAQFAAAYSARLYDQSSRVARDVAAHLRDHPDSDDALHAYLKARAGDTSLDSYIVVLDANGRVRATSESAEVVPGNYGGPGFAQHWTGNEQEIVPVLRSRITGAIIYSLSARLEDAHGRFLGVVGVNVRPEGIKPTAQRRPEEPLLAVWDQDGRFIAASFVDFDRNGRAIPTPKLPGVGLPGSPRSGPEAISASAAVQNWPLVAVASFDKAGVLAAWRRDVYEALAFAGLAVLGIGALVWLGVRTADREAGAKSAFQQASQVAAKAVSDRDLLMKEVHHRVKNSLMMTAGLIKLQERQFADPAVREAFEHTRARLNSIGLVHEALYSGSSFEDVDLSAYLTRLSEDLAEAYGAKARGVKVTTQFEPVRLAAHQTTPVGLIVAEVIANAFKHAFPANDGGEIVVRTRLANPDEIEIEIRDNGAGHKGAVAASAAGGLGTRLIDALTQQLGGSISIANEGGAALRLNFPRLVQSPEIAAIG